MRDQEDTFRAICGVVALIMILVYLTGCQTAPVKIAKPQIPRDIQLHCLNGNWAIVSESAGEAAAFPLAAACGRGAV